MIFAQFSQVAVYPPGTDKVIEACGDRSVIILDGREKETTLHALAKQESIKRGYIGYTLYRGETFTRCKAISSFIDTRDKPCSVNTSKTRANLPATVSRRERINGSFKG